MNLSVLGKLFYFLASESVMNPLSGIWRRNLILLKIDIICCGNFKAITNNYYGFISWISKCVLTRISGVISADAYPHSS